MKRSMYTTPASCLTIEAIRRAADLERTDLAEIVNRAFERYFSTH